MKFSPYAAIFMFLAFFFQGRVTVLGIPPDLTALFAYYAGIKYGESRGLAIGAATGLLQDMISGSIIGPNLLSKGVIGFSASFFISGGFFRWTPVFSVIAVFMLTMFDNAASYMSRSLFDRMPAVLSTAVFTGLMQSILNAPAGIVISPDNAD